MSQYPIILIPPQIERIRSAQPSAQPFSQLPPTSPQKLNFTLIAIELIIAVIISQATSIPVLLLIGAIAFQSWYQIASYPERKEQYKNQEYEYSEKLRLYKQEAEVAKSPQRIAEWRYKQLLEVLRKTIPYDGNNGGAQRGTAEAQFGGHLNRYFPGKIYTRLTLNIPDFPYPYTPDFAYIDGKLNLYIDIEIDEPYAYHTKEPTHYVGAEKDNRRNNHFSDKGWIVIRFSEEQVVCYPHSCCKSIAGAIAQITGDSQSMRQFANTPDIQPARQWTKYEADEMAARGERNRYLR